MMTGARRWRWLGEERETGGGGGRKVENDGRALGCFSTFLPRPATPPLARHVYCLLCLIFFCAFSFFSFASFLFPLFSCFLFLTTRPPSKQKKHPPQFLPTRHPLPPGLARGTVHAHPQPPRPAAAAQRVHRGDAARGVKGAAGQALLEGARFTLAVVGGGRGRGHAREDGVGGERRGTPRPPQCEEEEKE